MAELAPQPDRAGEARSVAEETASEIAAFRPAADLVQATMHLVVAALAEIPRDLPVPAADTAWAVEALAAVVAVAAEGAAAVGVDEEAVAVVVVNNQCPRNNK